MTQFAFFRFPDTASMRRYWSYRLSRLDLARGTRAARVRCIDESSDMYGIIDAKDKDIDRLVAWWETNLL